MNICSKGQNIPLQLDGRNTIIDGPFVSLDVTFCKSLDPYVNVILCLPFHLFLSVFRTILEKIGLQGKVEPH